MRENYTHQNIKFKRGRCGEEYIVPTKKEFALVINEETFKEQTLYQQKELYEELSSKNPLKFGTMINHIIKVT